MFSSNIKLYRLGFPEHTCKPTRIAHLKLGIAWAVGTQIVGFLDYLPLHKEHGLGIAWSTHLPLPRRQSCGGSRASSRRRWRWWASCNRSASPPQTRTRQSGMAAFCCSGYPDVLVYTAYLLLTRTLTHTHTHASRTHTSSRPRPWNGSKMGVGAGRQIAEKLPG